MSVVDYFLKIDGIQGESEDKTHPNECQLESWSFGASQGGTMAFGGGGGTGKVQMQDFHFVMKNCKASPKLFLACATGDHIKSAILVCRKAGKQQQEYLKYTFTDLLISSFTTSGSGAGDVLPMDQVSFNFAKIESAYREQNADGTLKGPIQMYYSLKQADGG
jgi:type VI secretion system secreted protein Hcp